MTEHDAPNWRDLPAGHELDRLVAERVMGVTDFEGWEMPHYSSHITPAWAVVERLRQAGWLVRVQEMPDGFPWLLDADDPRARVYKRAVCLLQWVRLDTRRDMQRFLWHWPKGFADTAPMAICRAALESVEEWEPMQAVSDG